MRGLQLNLKKLDLLIEGGDSKFVTRNWHNVKDQLSMNCSVGNTIIHSKEVLTSNLCGYNDAYSLARSDIIIMVHNLATEVEFKNCATFFRRVTKIDGTTIHDAENLNLVMPMCESFGIQFELFWHNKYFMFLL